MLKCCSVAFFILADMQYVIYVLWEGQSAIQVLHGIQPSVMFEYVMWCIACFDVIVILIRKSIFVQWADYEKFLDFRDYSRCQIVGCEVVAAVSMMVQGV